jgi:hypothetical protein
LAITYVLIIQMGHVSPFLTSTFQEFFQWYKEFFNTFLDFVNTFADCVNTFNDYVDTFVELVDTTDILTSNFCIIVFSLYIS